jgi:predicted MarR family transcription regulator
MSREFGSYTSGYFDSQMEQAASDLMTGSYALTRAWAPFFEEFCPVAYAIASSEAGDSGPDYSILETIRHIERLKALLGDIERHVEPYKRVADAAVRDALKAQERS